MFTSHSKCLLTLLVSALPKYRAPVAHADNAVVQDLAEVDSSIFSHAIGEVQYYFRCTIGGQPQTLALVSKYGPPDQTLLQQSSGVVWAARLPKSPRRHLEVVDVKSIVAAVAMIPCDSLPCAVSGVWDGQVYFVMDKLGVDIDDIVGAMESENDSDTRDREDA